jgi:hypothetical protein
MVALRGAVAGPGHRRVQQHVGLARDVVYLLGNGLPLRRVELRDDTQRNYAGFSDLGLHIRIHVAQTGKPVTGSGITDRTPPEVTQHHSDSGEAVSGLPVDRRETG